MAKATVKLNCTVCGAEYYHTARKTFFNRAQANSYCNWAQKNITECPECYKARIEAEKADADVEVASA